MTPVLIGLAALGAYAVGILGLRLIRTPSAGIAGLDGGGPVRSQRSLLASFHAALGRRLEPIVRRITGDRARRRLEHWLDAAGRPDRWTIGDVMRAKGGDTGVCALLGLAATVVHPLIGPLVLLYGFFRRDLRLRAAAMRRQARIERDLPDFLDILGVTIQAGLKFRGALRRVGEQFDSPVADEFRIALQQLDVGASRRAAFEGLRDRNDSPSLNRFVGALLQSEELGAPLSDAMASIARDMRKVFSQNVRKEAAKAAPKVTLVATVLLMPASALLLIGGLVVGGDIEFGGLFGG